MPFYVRVARATALPSAVIALLLVATNAHAQKDSCKIALLDLMAERLYDHGVQLEDRPEKIHLECGIKKDGALTDPRVTGITDAQLEKQIRQVFDELATDPATTEEIRTSGCRLPTRTEKIPLNRVGRRTRRGTPATGPASPDKAASAEKLVQRGDARLQAGDTGGAETAYRQALHADPDSPDAAAGLARVRLARGKTLQAYPMLRRALSKHPDHAEAYYALGLLHQERKAPPLKTIQTFNRYLSLSPKGPNAADAQRRVRQLQTQLGLVATAPAVAPVGTACVLAPDTQCINPEGACVQRLLRLISSAKKTLDIAIYRLDHPDIASAIRAARQRAGQPVRVRMLVDHVQSRQKAVGAQLAALRQAGIEIKRNKGRGIMHVKVAIVDGLTVAEGSFNYTRKAATVNHEQLSVHTCAPYAAKNAEWFEARWQTFAPFEP